MTDEEILENFRKEFWTNDRINIFGTICFALGGGVMAFLFLMF